MKINKQLFEDILSGKLKGTLVLSNGTRINTSDFKKNVNGYMNIYPYRTKDFSYTEHGYVHINSISKYDVVDFIPDTNMKENELTIEIPDGKIVDWEESKKQNKIVLKDKQLTYEDICEKYLKNDFYFIQANGGIGYILGARNTTSNCSKTQHQLECILAKNKLANVAMYLNDGWKPTKCDHTFAITCLGNNFDNKLIVGEYYFGNGENLIVFKTQKAAQQAIEILGEETVKLALEPLGI